MRTMRRMLNAEQQQKAAAKLTALVLADADYRRAGKIAFYRAFDGEINPHQLLLLALEQGKRCYLPVLDKDRGSMIFTEYEPDKPMLLNDYGIEEPATGLKQGLAAENLDVILLPLVAFDTYGTRLGMGKGYYDRSLTKFHENGARYTTKLIGLAHEFQRVAALERAAWDIPLDKIITDRTTYCFRSDQVS